MFISRRMHALPKAQCWFWSATCTNKRNLLQNQGGRWFIGAFQIQRLWWFMEIDMAISVFQFMALRVLSRTHQLSTSLRRIDAFSLVIIGTLGRTSSIIFPSTNWFISCVGQTGWLFFCCCPHCILSNRQAISALSVCHAPGVLVESLAPELIQNKSPQGYIWNKVLLVCNKFHVRACLAHGFIPGQEW